MADDTNKPRPAPSKNDPLVPQHKRMAMGGKPNTAPKPAK